MATQNILVGAPAISYVHPTIRRIRVRDVGDALREGVQDFQANPTHLVFLCLVYPVMGLVLGRMASGSDALALIYPLVGGFALIGPLASVGLYTMSRRREQGLDVSFANAFDVFGSPRVGAILALGLAFVGIFIVWLGVAQAIFNATMPGGSATSLSDFTRSVVTTSAGWQLMVVGTAVGFVFAVVSLAIGLVSFPLLVDRDVAPTAMEQAVVAVQTSIRATLANPIPVALWGAIVAISLALSSLTLLVALAVVMPVLGHGTWHLYRKLVAP